MHIKLVIDESQEFKHVSGCSDPPLGSILNTSQQDIDWELLSKKQKQKSK